MIQITNIFYWHIYNKLEIEIRYTKGNIDRYRYIYIYVRVIKIIIIIQKTWLIIKYDHPSMKIPSKCSVREIIKQILKDELTGQQYADDA